MTTRDYLLMHRRGLTRRCPRCGAGGLFTRWTEMVERCPACGLEFEREEGYWVGAMTYNIVVTELIFAAGLAVVVITAWPDIPIAPLIAVGVLVNALVPIIFYPISKTLWLATDLSFLHPLAPLRDRR
jgi:uncharacterized protein (DUF983 family)